MNRKEEIKSMIKKVVAKHLNGDYRVFLFGSQAGRPELKRADIDVGIIAEHPLTNLQESLIYTDLEDLPTLYKFDLVDFKKTDEHFQKIAIKNLEMI